MLAVALRAAVFGFLVDFALSRLVPGTAAGVVVGDVLFTWMAFRLARRTGRTDVTAMPPGLDTPSTFGMVSFVLRPGLPSRARHGPGGGGRCRHCWWAAPSTPSARRLDPGGGSSWPRCGRGAVAHRVDVGPPFGVSATYGLLAFLFAAWGTSLDRGGRAPHSNP
ncbi:MAG: hypothetical protein EBR86_16155 [Planctomycetia bacterium]|nr:hypothetical protein [Planctomycetia bacterium]